MRFMLSWLVLVVLLGAAPVSQVRADTSYLDTSFKNNENLICGASCNNTSGLHVSQHTVFAQVPKIVAIGKGYYSDHPISYDSQTGKQTWIKSKVAGVSMAHEVSSAHNLSQTLDISAIDSSRRDNHGMTASNGVGMKVAEDVQDGKVSIGVLQGGGLWNGQSPSATAMRNPSLDIEEDYFGDFHIEKNMTIQMPIRQLQQYYSWLPCCYGSYFDMPDNNGAYIGGKSVFDYRR